MTEGGLRGNVLSLVNGEQVVRSVVSQEEGGRGSGRHGLGGGDPGEVGLRGRTRPVVVERGPMAR